MAAGRKTGGRKKGTPNKVNAMTREAIGDFLARKWDRIDELFDKVASEDPYKALVLIKDLAEYSIPKLSRSELMGPDGGPLTLEGLVKESASKHSA